MVTNKTLDNIIDDVIEHMEFDRIHKAMMALEWRWHGCSDSTVPSEIALALRSRSLLMDTAKECMKRKTEFHMSTGGFYASAYYYEDQEFPYLSIKFVVAESDSDY